MTEGASTSVDGKFFIEVMAIIKRLWRVSRSIAYVIAVFLVLGALYQFVATRSDERKYPPAGEIVNVNGHGLHLNCTGEGTPTVILEAGLGGGSLDWSLVQPEVAKFGRVCSYDRAGIVWSTADDGPRGASKIAQGLHTLLETAHVPPPYVLVGHSIGGVYVQMFAARYPSEVAGVVLVDSSHQDQLETVGGIPFFVPYVYKAAAPVGIARIVNQIAVLSSDRSTEADAERAALYSRTLTVFAIADEMAGIPESLSELRASPMQLGAKPLMVLSRGLSDGASPETQAAWNELQNKLVKCSSNGKQVIANKSGHYIQLSEPELVVDAIRQVENEAARAKN